MTAARLAVLIALAAAPALHAQEWRATIESGRLRLDGTPAGHANALGVRIARDAPRSGMSITAALPLDDDDPMFGALSGWYRVEGHSTWRAGLGIAAEAWLHGSSAIESGRGVAIEAGPDVSLDAGPARLDARASVFGMHRVIGASSDTRTVPSLAVQVSGAPLPRLDLVAEAAAYRSDGHSPVGASVLARWTRAPFTAWASAGAWLTGEAAPPRGAGIALKITERISATASVQRRTFDPLFAARPATLWSIGAGVRLGGSAALRAPVAPADADGRTTILLDAGSTAGTPRIAGDFNGWIPQPMTRDGERWSFTVRLKPGVYHYAFVSPDGTWFVPPSTPGRREDGMGGHVAVLIVSGA